MWFDLTFKRWAVKRYQQAATQQVSLIPMGTENSSQTFTLTKSFIWPFQGKTIGQFSQILRFLFFLGGRLDFDPFFAKIRPFKSQKWNQQKILSILVQTSLSTVQNWSKYHFLRVSLDYTHFKPFFEPKSTYKWDRLIERKILHILNQVRPSTEQNLRKYDF